MKVPSDCRATRPRALCNDVSLFTTASRTCRAVGLAEAEARQRSTVATPFEDEDDDEDEYDLERQNAKR